MEYAIQGNRAIFKIPVAEGMHRDILEFLSRFGEWDDEELLKADIEFISADSIDRVVLENDDIIVSIKTENYILFMSVIFKSGSVPESLKENIKCLSHLG